MVSFLNKVEARYKVFAGPVVDIQTGKKLSPAKIAQLKKLKPKGASPIKKKAEKGRNIKGKNFEILKDSSIGKRLAQEIAAEFAKIKYFVSFGSDYINISRPDGVHCEFYGSQGENHAFASATYTLDGEMEELDFALPSDLDDFVDAVKNILTF